MTHNIIYNSHKYTKYYDLKKEILYEKPEEFLTVDLVKNSCLEAHIINSKYFVPLPNNYIPVLKNIIPIPPRTRWVKKGLKFEPIIYDPKRFNENDLQKIIKTSARILSSITKEKIAVELSGGLDTSIIISILRESGINPVLIGFKSNAYEFRTERVIQEIYALNSPETLFIESHYAFQDLDKIPFHPIPNKASLYSGDHIATLKKAKSIGVKTVINGIGADALLCNKVIGNKFPNDMQRWAIDDSWPNDYIFKPEGVIYKSAATIRPFAELIWSLRFLEDEDVQKFWARNFFKNILPTELTSYSYKAGFDSYHEQGLQNHRSQLLQIVKTAYELTKNDNLNPKHIEKLIDNSQENSHQSTIELLASLSYSVWINCIIMNNKI
jgi:hypothetical protein